MHTIQYKLPKQEKLSLTSNEADPSPNQLDNLMTAVEFARKTVLRKQDRILGYHQTLKASIRH